MWCWPAEENVSTSALELNTRWLELYLNFRKINTLFFSFLFVTFETWLYLYIYIFINCLSTSNHSSCEWLHCGLVLIPADRGTEGGAVDTIDRLSVRNPKLFLLLESAYFWTFKGRQKTVRAHTPALFVSARCQTWRCHGGCDSEKGFFF